jgi:threonine dehydrogenase-like Zn-dependent dehydrogenase
MGELLTFSAPRQVTYETYDDPPLAPDEMRIRTLFSGISAGTEMTQYRGTNPYLTKRWDADQRLFLEDSATSLTYPIRNLGYEEVGEVIEVGSEVGDIAPGALVFGTWGHRTHHVANTDYVRPRLMPPGAEAIFGIFSHIGAIALNGIHDGQIRIGDTVAVFGSGVLGQIVAQAARNSGARVIAIDMHEARLACAKEMGAHMTLNAKTDKVAEAIKDLTGGRGADVCFEVTGATSALNEAIRAVAYSARVVAMGFFQGEAKGLYLGEEFHHNRVNLVCSQISGVAPDISYRWNKMRLWQSAVQLQADGLLNIQPLISHQAPFHDAARLFHLLDEQPEDVMQAVLEFPAA